MAMTGSTSKQSKCVMDRYLTENLECSSDEEPEQSPKSRFRRGCKRLICVQRLASFGVKSKHLLNFKVLDKHLESIEEGDTFLGKLLNYGPLMLKSSKALKQLHASLFATTPKRNQSHAFALIAKALHDIKKATIVVAWLEHVKPAREELSTFKIQYDSLKTQFTEARTSYLKEVSELRDSVRKHGDQLDGIDQVTFFEPTQCLEPEERKFLLNVMQEKFKMMVSTNKCNGSSFDWGQIETLQHQVQGHELKQLRESLNRKDKEITKLREIIAEDNAKQARQSCTHLHGDQELVVQGLREQIEKEQCAANEAKHELNLALKQIDSLSIDRDKFARRLRSEKEAQNKIQEECEQHLTNMQQLEDSKSVLEQSVHDLTRALHELQEKNDSLSKSLQRSKRSQTPRKEVECLFVSEHMPAMGCMSSSLTCCDSGINVFSKKHVDHGIESCLPSSLQDDAESISADSSPKVNLVKEDVPPLENNIESIDLVEQHQILKESSTKEASDLTLATENQGCRFSNPKIADCSRLCSCGNVLMEDSRFCRKCGVEWATTVRKPRRHTFASFSVQLGSVKAQFQGATRTLNDELENMQAANDSLQLKSALDKTLVALSSVKKLMGRSKSSSGSETDEEFPIEDVDETAVEDELISVFHRLCDPNSETKNKWKRRRQELQEANANPPQILLVNAPSSWRRPDQAKPKHRRSSHTNCQVAMRGNGTFIKDEPQQSSSPVHVESASSGGGIDRKCLIMPTCSAPASPQHETGNHSEAGLNMDGDIAVSGQDAATILRVGSIGCPSGSSRLMHRSRAGNDKQKMIKCITAQHEEERSATCPELPTVESNVAEGCRPDEITSKCSLFLGCDEIDAKLDDIVIKGHKAVAHQLPAETQKPCDAKGDYSPRGSPPHSRKSSLSPFPNSRESIHRSCVGKAVQNVTSFTRARRASEPDVVCLGQGLLEKGDLEKCAVAGQQEVDMNVNCRPGETMSECSLLPDLTDKISLGSGRRIAQPLIIEAIEAKRPSGTQSASDPHCSFTSPSHSRRPSLSPAHSRKPTPPHSRGPSKTLDPASEWRPNGQDPSGELTVAGVNPDAAMNLKSSCIKPIQIVAMQAQAPESHEQAAVQPDIVLNVGNIAVKGHEASTTHSGDASSKSVIGRGRPRPIQVERSSLPSVVPFPRRDSNLETGAAKRASKTDGHSMSPAHGRRPSLSPRHTPPHSRRPSKSAFPASCAQAASHSEWRLIENNGPADLAVAGVCPDTAMNSRSIYSKPIKPMVTELQAPASRQQATVQSDNALNSKIRMADEGHGTCATQSGGSFFTNGESEDVAVRGRTAPIQVEGLPLPSVLSLSSGDSNLDNSAFKRRYSPKRRLILDGNMVQTSKTSGAA